MDPNKSTTFRNPKRTRINIACVYLTNYFLNDDQGEVAKTRTVLDRHNLQLEVWPQNGMRYAGNVLEYPDVVPHDSYDDAANRASYKSLVISARNFISSKVPFSTYLTVVFGQFKHPGIGITPQGMPTTTPLCIISPNANPDKMDLLHEIGHASDLHHENAPANFMNLANGRSEMMKFQVEKVARSWFTVG